MADNVRGGSTDSALPNIATDDVGGVHYQRVKLDVGADGASTPVTAADPLPVVQTGTPGLPTGASTLAEQQSQTTALQIIDDWDESDRAKANIIVGQAGVAAGAGAVGATVQRMTLASDDPAVAALQILDNAISGNAATVRNNSIITTVTPTLDTSAYASGDSLHTTVLSFTNAVSVSGGTGILESLVISDHDVQSAAGELWLFSATVTPATANAAHSISDGDADLCIGVVPFGPYYASALNSVSVSKGIGLPIKCAATTLFGILVTRGTPTYTASGLVVRLQISSD